MTKHCKENGENDNGMFRYVASAYNIVLKFSCINLIIGESLARNRLLNKMNNRFIYDIC